MEPTESLRPTAVTLPLILVGTLLGSIICLVNMHFGFKIGTLDTMSSFTALLSFTIFKTANCWLHEKYEAPEAAVVLAIASAVGAMPLAAGLTGAIPAMEFLKRPEEGG